MMKDIEDSRMDLKETKYKLEDSRKVFDKRIERLEMNSKSTEADGSISKV